MSKRRRCAVERGDIERLVQRWTQEVIAEGRLETFDELLAADVLDRSGPVPSLGVEPFKARAAAVRAAFDEIEIRLEDLIVDGDAVAWRWALTGTHVGTFAAVAPTGRKVTLRGVNFQRLRGDRVIEHWTMVDVFGATLALRA
jgi:predicted ester cyclase